MTPTLTVERLLVTGVVQGVGFRPHVHRLAVALGLHGLVGNEAGAVFVEVEGPAAAVDELARRIVEDAPPLAVIEAVERRRAPVAGHHGFAIAATHDGGGPVVTVPADTAVCAACLREMWDPSDRRYLHPFITCTDCGPRFTVIRRLPYDRPATTMDGFAMCARCRAEYDDPADRRHHAQPVACHDCGPVLSLSAGGSTPGAAQAPVASRHEALAAARRALAGGAIVAVKGIGGYHLVCDARSDAAVAELRRRKGRADKPLAVMVADGAAAAHLVHLDAGQHALLTSPARPIVLATRRGDGVSPLVAPGNPLLGVLLPYTPVHHLLLCDPSGGGPRAVLGPLVVTSTNRSGEPICYRDDEVAIRVAPLADWVLGHDRPIEVPCDDSVVRAHAGRVLPVRRSRGFAPLSVPVPPVPCDILAVGGEMKSAFCLASGHRAWMSQHIGEMGTLETLEAFEASVERLCALYRVDPAVVAVDAHPGYTAGAWARRRWPGACVEVQHHHAHVGALIAEHGLDPLAPVIGIAFDGTGYGDDGAVWGGEVLVASAAAYRRAAHLAPVPLAGGDAAVREPWRVALAHLRAAGIAWGPDLPPVAAARPGALRVVGCQLDSGAATVPTTSMGRLFDAVASLLGIRQHVGYEAQAAIELEHVAASCGDTPWPMAFDVAAGGGFDAAPVVAAIVHGMRDGAGPARLAAGFHRAVVDMVATVCRHVRDETGLLTVALTGGVWQNVLLVDGAVQQLEHDGFDVRTHRVVPPNDGGLALGQALVAAHRPRPTIAPKER